MSLPPREVCTPPYKRHRWRATWYGGQWVEFCEHGCSTWRSARMRPNGTPVALR